MVAGLLGLPQGADRVVAAQVDGDVEVPLRLGQPGARLRADRARGGCR